MAARLDVRGVGWRFLMVLVRSGCAVQGCTYICGLMATAALPLHTCCHAQLAAYHRQHVAPVPHVR